jgi:hypothetical protein
MTNKKIQELTDKLSYYFDQCKEKDLIIGNFIGWLLNESNLVEAGVSDDFLRELHKLTDSVDQFAIEMKHRLIKKMFEGYTGWDDPSMREQWANDLRDQLVEDLNNGKEADIANRAMMLYFLNRQAKNSR